MALLDYTLYLWHILVHKVPLLWRFHLPHHVDLDMDASTALRFHFRELALSVPAAQPRSCSSASPRCRCRCGRPPPWWRSCSHHSNVELPLKVARWLCRLIVTPRMHGIHHTTVLDQTNSNWSSGLTVWSWSRGLARPGAPPAPGAGRPDRTAGPAGPARRGRRRG